MILQINDIDITTHEICTLKVCRHASVFLGTLGDEGNLRGKAFKRPWRQVRDTDFLALPNKNI